MTAESVLSSTSGSRGLRAAGTFQPLTASAHMLASSRRSSSRCRSFAASCAWKGVTAASRFRRGSDAQPWWNWLPVRASPRNGHPHEELGFFSVLSWRWRRSTANMSFAWWTRMRCLRRQEWSGGGRERALLLDVVHAFREEDRSAADGDLPAAHCRDSSGQMPRPRRARRGTAALIENQPSRARQPNALALARTQLQL